MDLHYRQLTINNVEDVKIDIVINLNNIDIYIVYVWGVLNRRL